MKNFAGVLFLLAIVSLLAFWQSTRPNRGLDKKVVEIGGRSFNVQIANTNQTRAKGLMFVEKMEKNSGMLFIHDKEEPVSYWMKNTKIPLDMLFFDSSLHLVSQQRNALPCDLGNSCPGYPSNLPAKYVLELNAGTAKEMNIQDGAVLKIK